MQFSSEKKKPQKLVPLRYVKETYLQKQKVSHCHIATTTKHKSYGMNLVDTKHKLTFL